MATVRAILEQNGYTVKVSKMLPGFLEVFNFHTKEALLVAIKPLTAQQEANCKQQLFSQVVVTCEFMPTLFKGATHALVLYNIDRNLNERMMKRFDVPPGSKIFYVKHCTRCGHKWEAKVQRPKECPRCWSENWDQPSEIASRTNSVSSTRVKKRK